MGKCSQLDRRMAIVDRQELRVNTIQIQELLFLCVLSFSFKAMFLIYFFSLYIFVCCCYHASLQRLRLVSKVCGTFGQMKI